MESEDVMSTWTWEKMMDQRELLVIHKVDVEVRSSNR